MREIVFPENGIRMNRLVYLLTHISIQLRLVSLLSSSVLFLVGVFLGFFSWTGLAAGACAGFLLGALFWLEAREPLYRDGQFPVSTSQKVSYFPLFYLYAVFLGCVVDRVIDVPSPDYVHTFLGVSLFGALGVLIVFTLVQLVCLTVYTFRGGLLDRFIWRDRQTGKEGMVGLIGEVAERLNPEGRIRVRGEFWNAELQEAGCADPGDRVTVQGIRGLTLLVRLRAPRTARVSVSGEEGGSADGVGNP